MTYDELYAEYLILNMCTENDTGIEISPIVYKTIWLVKDQGNKIIIDKEKTSINLKKYIYNKKYNNLLLLL